MDLTQLLPFTKLRNNFSVTESRGRYRYLHPDRDKRTTEKTLGSHYGKLYLEQIFGNSERVKISNPQNANSVTVEDYRRNPVMILYYKSELRLVIDLQANVKAMQNQAYERKVKITNLQQMANTIIFCPFPYSNYSFFFIHLIKMNLFIIFNTDWYPLCTYFLIRHLF